jgi:hypothetical protein
MRIRGDLPFVERDDSAVSIDITSEINFNKGWKGYFLFGKIFIGLKV